PSSRRKTLPPNPAPAASQTPVPLTLLPSLAIPLPPARSSQTHAPVPHHRLPTHGVTFVLFPFNTEHRLSAYGQRNLLEYFSYFSSKRVRREWLLQKRYLVVEHSVTNNRIIRITRHIKHSHLRTCLGYSLCYLA